MKDFRKVIQEFFIRFSCYIRVGKENPDWLISSGASDAIVVLQYFFQESVSTDSFWI